VELPQASQAESSPAVRYYLQYHQRLRPVDVERLANYTRLAQVVCKSCFHLVDGTCLALFLIAFEQKLTGRISSFHNPKGQRLGTITNGIRFGQVGALFITAPLIQRYGRRVPIALGSAILLVGVVLQTSAQNYGMFLVGRILIGFGNNIQQTTCPILLAELTYPDQRPKIIGITNTTGSLGQLMAAVSMTFQSHLIACFPN
jgi:MFS family permease